MATANNVQAWSSTAANNATADSTISSSDSQSPDTVDNDVRNIMSAVRNLSKDLGGFATAAGTANAHTVTSAQVISAAHLTDGYRITYYAPATNTTAAVTVAVDGLTATTIKRADGTALAIGSIIIDQVLDLVYESTSSVFRAVNIAPAAQIGAFTGFLFGLTISNTSGGTTAISVAAGAARDSTDIDMLTLAAAITTKTLSVAWAVGSTQGMLDTGAVANTTYHIYLIKRVDTGVVDVIASTSASSPTLPASYTLYRRIGSIIRSGGAIVLFSQLGDEFLRLVPSNDSAAATWTTTASLVVCGVPTGIQVSAIVFFYYNNASTIYGLVTAPDQTDTLPAVTQFNLVSNTNATAPTFHGSVRTDTSGQVRIRTSASIGAAGYSFTRGWIDTRGRLV